MTSSGMDKSSLGLELSDILFSSVIKNGGRNKLFRLGENVESP